MGITLRKLLSQTIRHDALDGSSKGMEYEYLGDDGGRGARKYKVTFYHQNPRKHPLVIAEIKLGQDMVLSAERVFEVLYQDMSDWFDAQENYGAEGRSPRQAYIKYCVEEGLCGVTRARGYADILVKMAHDLKRFFGEDWQSFGNIDFRSHAFHYKPEESHELPIAIWQYREEAAEEWGQVQAVIWYKYVRTQPLYLSVTGRSCAADHPDSGHGGATILPELNWRPEQRKEMEALEAWHLKNISDPDELHFEEIWTAIMNNAQEQFWPRLEMLYSFIKAGKLQDFFTEKQHIAKEGEYASYA